MSHQSTDEAQCVQKKPSLTHLNSSGEAHMVNLPPPFPPSSSLSETPSTGTPGVSEEDKSVYKSATTRVASATTIIEFSNGEPYRLISASLQPTSSSTQSETKLPKGDVIATSRIAGIMAAKRTADLIPLCHNIPLSGVNVDIELIAPSGNTSQSSFRPSSLSVAASSNDNIETPYGAVKVEATVKTYGQTGVEMEALTAASVAGLTVYDMCKAVDRGMKINNLRVTFKSGGRSGEWRDGIKVP